MLYIVIVIVRMVVVASMIGGSSEISCGIRLSEPSVSLTRPPRSSVSLSMPSSASNADRSAQQMGVSKQCRSQWR